VVADRTEVARPRHPGQGLTHHFSTPKGRQVDQDCVTELRELLGDIPLRRDLLIEHLHVIQDHYGCLHSDRLVALAHMMRLALSEVYETATFYAHFDIVAEDENLPPPITIRVCDSLTCEMFGAQELLQNLRAELEPGVRVVRAPCMGRCDTAPTVEIGHNHIDNASVSAIANAIEAKEIEPIIPKYENFESYCSNGGYSLLKDCQNGKKTPDELIVLLQDSPLRGLGGAGFPTGLKWKIVRGYEGPRLMAVNADEGEPGTFKDRHYLEREPHRFLEGVLIAAWVVEAQTVYIYLRDEYPAVRKILLCEIEAVRQAGLLNGVDVELRRGAGAYICGEESSMIESIEGKRGLPRHRPPYVAENGIFNRPTLVQNVETLYWVRDIVEKGWEWFASHGRNGSKGLRSYSVSGRVAEPGVKLAPAGITVRELIDEFCGGMLPGHQFKAYLPGGASGGILPASMDNLPLDFGQLEQYGCFVGSHAVVILSDQDNTKDAALNLMRFFEDESCGQCTPCRVGTEKSVKLMERNQWDTLLLKDIGQAMADASICGLGQAAANPILSVMKFFPDEVECKTT
jgi:formate dehydrogenase